MHSVLLELPYTHSTKQLTAEKQIRLHLLLVGCLKHEEPTNAHGSRKCNLPAVSWKLPVAVLVLKLLPLPKKISQSAFSLTVFLSVLEEYLLMVSTGMVKLRATPPQSLKPEKSRNSRFWQIPNSYPIVCVYNIYTSPFQKLKADSN